MTIRHQNASPNQATHQEKTWKKHIYPLVIKGVDGEYPIKKVQIWKSSINGKISIVTFDYRTVHDPWFGCRHVASCPWATWCLQWSSYWQRSLTASCPSAQVQGTSTCVFCVLGSTLTASWESVIPKNVILIFVYWWENIDIKMVRGLFGTQSLFHIDITWPTNVGCRSVNFHPYRIPCPCNCVVI